MPDRESRYRVVWEFLRQGDPGSIQQDVQKLEESYKRLNEAQGKANNGKPVVPPKEPAEGLSKALREAGDAAYHFGQGAMWANLPGTQFLATSGNIVQGVDWMTRGFGELISKVPPAAAALVGVTVAVVALGVGMVASVKAADELIARIRTVGEVTGLTLGQSAQALSTFQGMLGPQGAVNALSSVSQQQAGLSMLDLFTQQSATGQAGRMGAGTYFNPVYGNAFARYGLSLDQPGSTPQQRRPKDPDQVLFEVAKDYFARRERDPQAARIELAQLAPMVGGTDAITKLAAQFEAGRAQGQSPDQVQARLQRQRSPLFVPTPTDIQNQLQFEEATNNLNATFKEMLAMVGGQLLPIFGAFIKGLGDGLHAVLQVGKAVGDVLAPFGGWQKVLAESAYLLGLVVGALAGFAALLVGVIIPVVGTLLAPLGSLLNLFKAMAGQASAMGLAFHLTEDPFKRTATNFGYFQQQWKAMDFTSASAEAKRWADVTGVALGDVATEKDKLLVNVNLLQEAVAQPIDINVRDNTNLSPGFQSVLGLLTGTQQPTPDYKLTFDTTLTGQWQSIEPILTHDGDYQKGVALKLDWDTASNNEPKALVAGPLNTELARKMAIDAHFKEPSVDLWTGDARRGLSVTWAWAGGLVEDAQTWISDGKGALQRVLATTWNWAAGLVEDAQSWVADGKSALARGLAITWAWAAGLTEDAQGWVAAGKAALARGLSVNWAWAAGLADDAQGWIADGKGALQRGLSTSFTWASGLAEDFATWLAIHSDLNRMLTMGHEWKSGVLLPDFAQWLTIGSTLERSMQMQVHPAEGVSGDLWALFTNPSVDRTINLGAYGGPVVQPSVPGSKDVLAGGGQSSGGSNKRNPDGTIPGFDTAPYRNADGSLNWNAYNSAAAAAGKGGGSNFNPDSWIGWAMGNMGSNAWAGFCETFIEQATGSRNYPSAWDDAQANATRGDWRNAQRGQLLFFSPDASNGRAGHVGLYEGGGRMVSSLNSGVSESNLNDPYWSRLYYGYSWPKFGAAAQGAIVSQPMLSLIGEAGPEAIVPLNRLAGASPLPERLEAGLGGRGGATFVIHNDIDVAGMDFSDARSIERVTRAVSDRVMQNVRTLTVGMGVR